MRGVESHESGPTTGQWASANQNTTITTMHMSAALSVWYRNSVRRMATQSRTCEYIHFGDGTEHSVLE